jgi:BMFP domain-containing protein YqiC
MLKNRATNAQTSRLESRATLPTICLRNLIMLPPKALLDTLSSHASRLFGGDSPLPRAELEAQFKALLQSGFSKLELVSREEFDSQMVVLARTRARLEALEAKVAELEAKLTAAD